MKILFIGDTVARAGRSIVGEHLDSLRELYRIDFTILNCENAAAGFGVTPKIADKLLKQGIDVLTSGNHIWDRKEILPYLETEPRLLRPANYPAGNPGHGSIVTETGSGEAIAVINLQGRVFMPSIDDPFQVVDRMLAELEPKARTIIVDMHAEATAEKVAMARYLDGRVSAILGTHTHIPTADECILPEGTAYQTDVGMTGPFHSVIGMATDTVLERFLSQRPVRFEAASEGARLNATVVDIDGATGKARSIQRIQRP